MTIAIPKGEARAVALARGQRLAVVDVEGQQVGDLAALGPGGEYLSMTHTAGVLGRIRLKVGDRLVSNLRRPLLEVVADDVGLHDLLYPSCDVERYRSLGAAPGHRSCRQNLSDALGIPYADVPDPLNVFMNVEVTPSGDLVIGPPRSKAGDRIVFRALEDLRLAVSACPQDLNACNGRGPTDLRLEVLEG